MRLDERLGVARLAYLRAVADARARSTPASWQRLLAASRNVKDAIRGQERERARREAPAPPRRGGTASERALAVSPPPCEPVQRQELEREWERSRFLIAWSKRLVRDSRALCCSSVGRRLLPARASGAGRSGAHPPERQG